MSQQEIRLQNALDAALQRYEDRVGAAFPVAVNLAVLEDIAFYAAVFPEGDGILIEATTGVVDAIALTWHTALGISADLPEGTGIDLLGGPQHPVDMALRWLMQHELNHYAIGHFSLTDGAGLLEAGSRTVFGAVARLDLRGSPLHALSPQERRLAPLCLELQTDHDATEIVLGAYSSENWVLFRYYATCILSVILLIEREERNAGNSGETHPWAATRMFMLLGHLAELPMIPAYFRAASEGLESIPSEYLPDDKEMEGYNIEVVSRVFASGQILADAAGLSDLWTEMGSLQSLLADIDRAVREGARDATAFGTRGARQWADLKPLNDRLLSVIKPIGLPD
ncbi:hypothetical protein HKCCE4037_16640 [Rhodobacterales bacterium HKCCE4037]|nr:hypothetical protein [Rhodobacterales bacterium HKCCE4037]